MGFFVVVGFCFLLLFFFFGGGGGGQRWGADLRLGGLEDGIAMIFSLSHLLCTIISQMAPHSYTTAKCCNLLFSYMF